jgi:hypothetical protein
VVAAAVAAVAAVVAAAVAAGVADMRRDFSAHAINRTNR